MRKTLETIFLIVIVVTLAYIERERLFYAYHALYQKVLPCSSPITYSIGSVDPKFKLTQADFKSAIARAESIWEKGAGKELFQYDPDGALKVNLIYDYRQEATNKLAKLGLVVSDDRASYDTLKARYDALQSSYAREKAAYDARVKAFENKQSAYNTEVDYWNKRGGAPKDVYAQLQARKEELAQELSSLRATESTLNSQVDTVNALVVELNRLGTLLNITASEFNKIGSSRGREFTEGEYVSSIDGVKIDIYQFDSRAKLVRVLTHELGHALSLQHVNDPKAIMYRVNQGTNEALAPSDIAELVAHCGIK